MKRFICLILAAVMLFSLCACGKTANVVEDEDAETAETHIVVDNLDNEVEVPYEIDRIVICGLWPLASVLSVFFDSADKLVGIPPECMTAAENGLLGELYPEILNAETGYSKGGEVNIEELTKLEPDIVFCNTTSPELTESLAQLGIPTVALSVNKWGYNTIETLENWISLLSEIFPANDKTKVVENYCDNVYGMVKGRVADVPEEERAKVFFLFQYNETTMLSSGNSFFGQFWADAIGGKNVAEGIEKDNAVPVNMEQVYAWNPDLIFITNYTTATPDDLYNNTVGNYDWSGIDAVANRNVHKMPMGMYRSYTPGIDTPIALLWLAKCAYPELFEDVDIVAETRDYYKEVFGIELTDEQAERIFAPSTEAGKL